ncbi:MAG: nucleotide sugar dehydrogenase [Chitinophagales bacterium]|jgi:UDP-N-acetyl-D-galactosamine dehydrogenase|nr:nucleotide sugar dehydrogenase [Chitinophagales bacterium]
MYQELIDKKEKLAVIGLGYVGLPVALAFAKKISVIGFDIDSKRLEMMRQSSDPSHELEAGHFRDCDIHFTDDIEILRSAKFFIVAVPTPVDDHKVPDLRPLLSACSMIGKVLKKGDYIVVESTTYPGCTEEDCLPLIEKLSGLSVKRDFKIGYSPERINPGDKEHSFTKIMKVVSGCDAEALDEIANVYSIVVDAGIHKAPSIKVAEAAKIIENTQRDVNIALMNELSRIFHRLGINTHDVLDAAATKWNFLKFYPGLVGGHCISVDPYYLTYKASALGYEPEVINSGRRINDDMGPYIARNAVQQLTRAGKDPGKSKVLMMGTTFKENISDIRNSKVADLVRELKLFSVTVEITDPYASSEEVFQEYGFSLVERISNDYDAVILAVNHDEYKNLEEAYFVSITKPNSVFIDVKGVFRNKITKLKYWSL